MAENNEAMANAFIPGAVALDLATEAMIAKRGRLLGSSYRLQYLNPVEVVRGEGAWLYGPKDERWLDAYNNVTSLGHCHPVVVEAIRAQVGTLATNTRYLQDGILQLAEKLLATMPEVGGQMMLTCTGSEANDLATRLAKHATGGTGIIVTETAYHGITDVVSSYSPSLGPGVNIGQHVVTVPAPGDAGAEGAEGFGQAVRAAIAQMQRHGIRPAMLIVDTIFTSDGVRAAPEGFLAPAVAEIHAAGGLFIADEVQPGFTRTGSRFWGFQRHGIRPDIVTMGKPMGNGYPVASLVARGDLIEDFGKTSRYFNTFGGNTVACAAALAVLEVIEGEGLQDNCRLQGQSLKEGITALSQRYPLIQEVRGDGLMLGVELSRDGSPATAETSALVNGMRDKGVLISSSGKFHNTLKVRPPLVVSAAEIDQILTTMEEVIRAL